MSLLPLPPSRTTRLLQAYLAARYRWKHRNQWHALAIGRPAPELEQAHPCTRSFGLVSAWNPGSVERSDTANRAADADLHAGLEAQGFAAVPAFATAADRTWFEPGWLIFDIDLVPFLTLARRYGQLGALWWRRGEPVALYMDCRRPDDAFGDAHVNWLE